MNNVELWFLVYNQLNLTTWRAGIKTLTYIESTLTADERRELELLCNIALSK